MEPPASHTRVSELIWAVMGGTALATGADFFPALVRHLANALDVQHAFVAECTNPRKSRKRYRHCKVTDCGDGRRDGRCYVCPRVGCK